MSTLDSPEFSPLIAAFRINDNNNGWGPVLEPDQFKDLPYQKFAKADRIGKIADWTGASHIDKKNLKYQPQFAVGNVGQYSYFHEDDENQFTLVDTSKTIKPYQKKTRIIQNRNKKLNYNNPNINNNKQNPVNAKMNKQQTAQINKQQKKQKNYNTRNDYTKAQKLREPSVQVKEDWKVIEEIEFSRLSKLNLLLSNDPDDLKICGSLEYYDKTYDRLSTKVPKKLVRTKRDCHTVTTSDDSIIRELSKQGGNVFATDTIIATLMCCSRSVYPWDIVVTKIADKIFFDKRDNSAFDLLTVSETSTDPPQDEEKHINSPNNLALEATYINHNFSQQVLLTNKERYTCPDGNPFMSEGDEGEVPSVAYRYRRWNLGNSINLIIRSELDAVTKGPNDEIQFLNIKALNEWDSRLSYGIDWRSKLDSQPGAVLASEIKNNGCKLAKWTVKTLLSGADQLKFGFVSRLNCRATDKHVVLSTQQFKPNEFASQIALNMDNAWGIVRCIIDFLMRQKDGKYVIMKDPNKQLIRIYHVPDNTFSEDEAEEEDDEEDGNDEN